MRTQPQSAQSTSAYNSPSTSSLNTSPYNPSDSSSYNTSDSSPISSPSTTDYIDPFIYDQQGLQGLGEAPVTSPAPNDANVHANPDINPYEQSVDYFKDLEFMPENTKWDQTNNKESSGKGNKGSLGKGFWSKGKCYVWCGKGWEPDTEWDDNVK